MDTGWMVFHVFLIDVFHLFRVFPECLLILMFYLVGGEGAFFFHIQLLLFFDYDLASL